MTKEMYEDFVKILKKRNKIFLFFIVLLSVVLLATTAIAIIQLDATLKNENNDKSNDCIVISKSCNQTFRTCNEIITSDSVTVFDKEKTPKENAKKYIVVYISALLCGLFVITAIICIFTLVREKIKLRKYIDSKRKKEE